MRTPELIVGERYILDRADKPVATYQGKHTGKLTLADGSTFYGGDNMLRFTYIGEGGEQRTVLLVNGGEVSEPEATKLKRERLEAERTARADAAYAEATALLGELGLEVVKNLRETSKQSTSVVLRRYQYNYEESVDDIQIEEMTIGKLKLAIGRGQPIAAR